MCNIKGRYLHVESRCTLIGFIFSFSLSVGSDGAGRSGTYILIDMVLNKMAKGENRKACYFLGTERCACVAMTTWGAIFTENLRIN